MKHMIAESQAIANQANELGRMDAEQLVIIQRDLLPVLDHHFPAPARGDALPAALRESFQSLLSSTRELQVDLVPEIVDFIASIKIVASVADQSIPREEDPASAVKAWTEGASITLTTSTSASVSPVTPGRVVRGQALGSRGASTSRSTSRSPGGGRGAAGKKPPSPTKAPQDELLVNGVIKLNFGNSRTPKKAVPAPPTVTSLE